MNNNDKLKEECGVFGAYDFEGRDVSAAIYYGLLALQHRGQESCGIAVSDTKGPMGKAVSERLEEIVSGLGICRGCFTGRYPMEVPTEDIRGKFEQ